MAPWKWLYRTAVSNQSSIYSAISMRETKFFERVFLYTMYLDLIRQLRNIFFRFLVALFGPYSIHLPTQHSIVQVRNHTSKTTTLLFFVVMYSAERQIGRCVLPAWLFLAAYLYHYIFTYSIYIAHAQMTLDVLARHDVWAVNHLDGCRKCKDLDFDTFRQW